MVSLGRVVCLSGPCLTIDKASAFLAIVDGKVDKLCQIATTCLHTNKHVACQLK